MTNDSHDFNESKLDGSLKVRYDACSPGVCGRGLGGTDAHECAAMDIERGDVLGATRPDIQALVCEAMNHPPDYIMGFCEGMHRLRVSRQSQSRHLSPFPFPETTTLPPQFSAK